MSTTPGRDEKRRRGLWRGDTPFSECLVLGDDPLWTRHWHEAVARGTGTR